MPDQGEFSRAEPGIPEGTNAGLLSSSGTPIHSDTSSEPLLTGGGMLHTDSGRPSSATGMMGRVSNVADTGKSKLAGTMHDLGDRIEHKGREFQSGNVFVRPVGRVLNSTGEALEDGAQYLRSSDFGVIRDDVVTGIRNHPMLSAGIAVGCGWLLGRIVGGGDNEREDHDEHENEEEEEEERERSDAPGMMGMVRGKVGSLVASGIASIAARQVRDRIAGR